MPESEKISDTRKEPFWTIPNILSGYRLLSFPFVLVLILLGKEDAVGIIICINLVTDILDGLIARVFKLATKLGARLDSFADIGTYILVFWSLFVFKKEALGTDFIGIWIFLGFYIGTHLFSFLKFGTFPSLHLYSVKITGYLQGIYFFLLFGFAHYPVLFWIALGWGVLAWMEELAVLIYLRRMRSDVGSIVFLLKEKEKNGDN